MKNFAKGSTIISLIFSILACSVFTPRTNKPSEITLTDEKPIVVLDTGNSEFPRIVLYEGGEVIVPDLNVNQNGEIIGVNGATFIAPDGNSIYLYFENGMPVRAIVDEHLVQFENFTGDTVDITFVSPDGTITQKEKVPFDSNQIPSIGSQSSAHLAIMARLPNNKDIDWFPLVQNATTAFFCAAATAATFVPSGGTSAVLLGAGCAVLAYSTYLAIANKEPPTSVEQAGIVISGTGCALGVVGKKDPLAVKDCADAVIDIVDVAKKETQEIEQKLVTMVGANPDIKSELALETIIEPVATATPSIDYGCDNPLLTSEERSNCGYHIYVISDYVILEAANDPNPPCQGDARQPPPDTTRERTFYFGEDFLSQKIENNKYLTFQVGSDNDGTKVYTIFINGGYIHHKESGRKGGYYCIDESTWIISK